MNPLLVYSLANFRVCVDEAYPTSRNHGVIYQLGVYTQAPDAGGTE